MELSSILAHAGHGQHGLVAGFFHPITGIDHLLAAVVVGALAAISAKKYSYVLPIVFVTGMTIGGILAYAGVAMPGVEALIALSVIAFGVALAFRQSGPIWAACLLTGFFAIFHGHAHLSEMDSTSGVGSFASGLLVATALLHLLGVGLGRLIADLKTAAPARAIGSAVAVVGVLLLVGIV